MNGFGRTAHTKFSRRCVQFVGSVHEELDAFDVWDRCRFREQLCEEAVNLEVDAGFAADRAAPAIDAASALEFNERPEVEALDVLAEGASDRNLDELERKRTLERDFDALHNDVGVERSENAQTTLVCTELGPRQDVLGQDIVCKRPDERDCTNEDVWVVVSEHSQTVRAN